MSFLKTIRVYDSQSEAELDKSMLEGHGFTVNLLNHDSAMSEFGGLLKVQLQVPGDEFADAQAVLQVERPRLQGSPDKVRKEEASIGRAFRRFGLTHLAVWIALYLFVVLFREGAPLATIALSFAPAIVFSFPLWLLVEYLRRNTKAG